MCRSSNKTLALRVIEQGTELGKITWRPGVSIPAVMTRFDMTKQDILKGRKTGWPVSENGQLLFMILCHLQSTSAHQGAV